MNEKITDGARGMFEKATGYVYTSSFFNLVSDACANRTGDCSKKVPEKFSN